MRFIAHRGNISGEDLSNENKISQILLAMRLGFDVEIDITLQPDGNLYLGHDAIQEIIDFPFLIHHSESLWVHCKDYRTFLYLVEFDLGLNLFYHTTESAVFTSAGHLWTHINETKYCSKSIALKFNYEPGFISNNKNILGICSDNPKKYLEEYNKKAP